jgi:mitochondrial intermediate peptidase
MKLAKLSGFETYAHRENVNMILETPNNVNEFLKNCAKSIKSKADNDYEIMRKYKRDKLKSMQPLMPWDVQFITHNIKSESRTSGDFLKYLSVGSCMDGLNLVLNEVFNTSLEVVETKPGELWHKDVQKIAVKDKNGTILGYIFCDFYQRKNKFTNIDCHFTIQCSKKMRDDSYQLPIVVLHLNFLEPPGNVPPLLNIGMMKNLFHEFGHATHSIFAKTKYQHVAGTRCSTDFAEVPSQLMENYAEDPRVLKLFAKDHLTGQAPSNDLICEEYKLNKMFQASDLQTQVKL